jgi:glutamate 5-kinase
MNSGRFGGQKPTSASAKAAAAKLHPNKPPAGLSGTPLATPDAGEAARDERATLLQSARRIVFKLGTNVVAESEGSLCVSRLEPLVASFAKLKQAGIQVILVSSGAVGRGRGVLALHRTRTQDVVTKQACAAVGQAQLMHAYERLFHPHGINIAQVLLTEDDFIDRRRSSNLRHTMEKLLKLGVVPIVNENDTVSTAELEYTVKGSRTRIFSDNDRLAALVASRVDAQALILLSNVEGLLRLPAQNASTEDSAGPPGVPIPLVKEITPEIKALALGPSQGGRGGMLTKLEAAEIATRAGGITIIANGGKPDIVERIFRGENVGTAFVPATRMPGKRRWIAYAADVSGRIVVNAGARDAILRGKASLLWSGVVKVERRFKPMDVISIADPEGREIARGIANHGSEEVELLAAGAANMRNSGQPSPKSAVLVTRNNIVVFES